MLQNKQDKEGRRIYTLLCLLAVACYFDYRRDRIPNKFILFGLCVAAVWWIAQCIGLEAPLEESCRLLFRMGGVCLLFFLPYRLGMLGAGDVKLFTLSAAFLDGKDCVAFLAGSMLFAGLASIAKMAAQRNVKERMYYFCSYLADVIRLGKCGLYLETEQDRKRVSLHMAGPMLAGLLCHICGFY